MTVRPNIAIIGGGFTGAVVALNLLRRLPTESAKLTIIEPRAVLGAGLAYSTLDPAHRVNVPAARLLVLAEEPGAFDQWFKASEAAVSDPDALLPDGRAYPQRAVFGAYVDGLLRQAAAAPGAIPFEHIQCLAFSVDRAAHGFSIALENGGFVDADIIVLAVSHPPPAVPKPFRDVSSHPKFVSNPWKAGAMAGIGATDHVLIIGTALTAADVIASLKSSGHIGRLRAISRRGLVSRLRKMQQTKTYGDFVSPPHRTVLALLRAVRDTIIRAEASGSTWGAVMDGLRVQGQEVWSALPPSEKKRFLRHLRPFWDAHRYQMAPQPAAIIDAECAAGNLRICAARIQSVSLEGEQFKVTLKSREAGVRTEEKFDAIVNCTGPDHAHVVETNSVLRSLAAAGLICADAFGLGVHTDLSARAVSRTLDPSADIFIAGPLARATFGELMGLPQVSQHAALVAQEVAKQLAEQKLS
jgi:uncharacterized NAD(P)/FAD-binding protein YdhS